MECAPSASVIGGIIATFLVVSITYFGVWRPHKVHMFYRRQKITGPEYRPLIGNWADIWKVKRKFTRMKRHNYAHPAADVAVRSLPHLFHWSKLYGEYPSVLRSIKHKCYYLCGIQQSINQSIKRSRLLTYRNELLCLTSPQTGV